MEKQFAESTKWFESVYLNLYHSVTNTTMWAHFGQSVIKIIFIILVSRILVKVIANSVNRIFKNREKFQLHVRRVETMRSLVNNVSTYVIYFVAILLIMAQLGFNLAPVLASAGVVGLAVGFGAQNLVRDVITGFFIIFEDQFGVGDYIAIGKFTGTVQEIGLRITKIRSVTGELHIVPNGSIKEVTNFSVENSMVLLDVGVAYEENIDHVMDVLKDVLNAAKVEIEEIIGEPEVLGVQNLGPSEVVFRVTAECRPMGHFSASRKLRAMIKKAFDENGIEIPYPKMVTIANETKDLV
ncbi:MAG TPA: mechanosensitive ion channel family protein [Bacillota bacterium]|nr:mechanosensitive ion channel family protein [Bacillota bacterium]